MWAIALMPLQKALTLDLGFPLKASEVLMAVAILSLLFDRSRRSEAVSHARAASAVLALALFCSFAFRWLQESPVGAWRGFTRSPETDMAFYFVYGMFAILVFWTLLDFPLEMLKKQLHVATWVCGAATLFQWAMFSSGRTSVLEALNFASEDRDLALGQLTGLAQRSGPFVEGQHLGFVAGFLLLLALWDGKRATAVVALACSVYSQSTTVLIGACAAAAMVVAFAPKANRVVRVLVGAVAGAAALAGSGALRLLFRLQLAKVGIGSAELLERNVSTSMNVRTGKMQIAWTIMTEHPFLGVGPGRFGFFFFDHASSPPFPNYYWNDANRAIAENAYLHIGSEIGVVAALAFGFLMIYPLVFLAGRRNVAVGLATFVVVGLNTQSSWTFMPIWIFGAFMWLVVAQQRDEAPPGVDPHDGTLTDHSLQTPGNEEAAR